METITPQCAAAQQDKGDRTAPCASVTAPREDSASTSSPSSKIAAIVEQLLGPADWICPTIAHVQCPGIERHSTANSHRDCRLYLNRGLNLYCFHDNCWAARWDAVRKLRDTLELNRIDVRSLTGIDCTEESLLESYKRAWSTRTHAKALRSEILRQYRWPYHDIIDQSPVSVVGREPEHWRPIVELFRPGAVVWIGDKTDSGDPRFASSFRTSAEWLACQHVPGPLICPATFAPGVWSRSNANVAERPYFVVESDTLGRDEVGAVFKWLVSAVQLDLKAVVDTAGKSLHGWFGRPNSEVFNDLTIVLPELGCDAGMFRPSQPARLPGALRDGRYQKLVFLSKGGAQ